MQLYYYQSCNSTSHFGVSKYDTSPAACTNLVFKRRNIQAIEQINTCQKCVPQRFHCLSTSRDRYKTLKALIKIDVQTPFQRKTRMIYRRGLVQRCASIAENTAVELNSPQTQKLKLIVRNLNSCGATRTDQRQLQIKSKKITLQFIDIVNARSRGKVEVEFHCSADLYQ